MELGSDPASLVVRDADPERVGATLLELDAASVTVAELALGQPSLDEVFLALTGRPPDNPTTEEDQS